MSSCGGIWPSGISDSISARTSSVVMPRASDCHCRYMSTDGPPIQPGATALTRTRLGPSSIASVCIAVCSAPFDVE